MPKRVAAIDTQFLLRHVASLDDGVLLLPEQVIIFTGMTREMLKERRRTRPPQPPFPMPREKQRKALWYSLGEVRRYLSEARTNAELDAVVAKQRHATLATFVNQGAPQDTWPIALVGSQRKPVDFFATVRGDIAMTRKDRCQWMTLQAYMERLNAFHEQAEDEVA